VGGGGGGRVSGSINAFSAWEKSPKAAREIEDQVCSFVHLLGSVVFLPSPLFPPKTGSFPTMDYLH